MRICLDPSDQKNITASRPDKMSDQVVHNFPWGISHIFIFELWFRPTEGIYLDRLEPQDIFGGGRGSTSAGPLVLDRDVVAQISL